MDGRGRQPGGGQIITGSGGASRLVFQTAGTVDLSGVSGFPTIVLANTGANSTSLDNANFVGLSSTVITVNGGDFGNTVDASALTGANRVVLNGGVRADHAERRRRQRHAERRRPAPTR